MKKGLFILGLIFLFIGFVFTLIYIFNITGYAVSEQLDFKNVPYYILFFFLAGIITMSLGKRESESALESDVRAYDSSNGKSKEHDKFYIMEDQHGRVSLGQLKNEVSRIDGDPELMQIIREDHSPGLIKIVKSHSNGYEVARAFLDVLGIHVEEKNEKYELSKNEKNEIKAAFKEWSGTPDSRQKKILDRYNLVYEKGSPHGHIKRKDGKGGNVIVSSTPSDWREGRNDANQIIKYIENNYE